MEARGDVFFFLISFPSSHHRTKKTKTQHKTNREVSTTVALSQSSSNQSQLKKNQSTTSNTKAEIHNVRSSIPPNSPSSMWYSVLLFIAVITYDDGDDDGTTAQRSVIKYFLRRHKEFAIVSSAYIQDYFSLLLTSTTLIRVEFDGPF